MLSTTLNYKERALLFRRLATMQHAGIDIIHALATLADTGEKRLNKKALDTVGILKTGTPLDVAAKEMGLFDTLEVALVKTGLETGTSEHVFSSLAKEYETRSAHLRAIKSRLILPAGILLLAGFITPLPRLAKGLINLPTYLINGIGFAFLILLCLFLVTRLPLWLRQASSSASPLVSIIDNFILYLPIIGKWYKMKTVTQWLQSAELALESGLSPFAAFPLLRRVLVSPRIRKAFEQCEQSIRDGTTITDAFNLNPYLEHETKNFINTGESSGRLPEMLKHSANLETQRLNLLEQQLSEWIPRLVYFIILAALASNIAGSEIVPSL